MNWQTDHEKSDSNRWQNLTISPSKNTTDSEPKPTKPEPQAVAWLSNLFAPKPQAKVAGSLGTADAALAIEALVNGGAVSLGAAGRMANIKHHQLSQPHAPKQKINATKNLEMPKESGEETAAQAQPSEKDRQKPKRTRQRTVSKREAGSRRESRGEIIAW